ncbi:MAG: NADPH:quinone oxidoreductase family protein [Lautropia sp.]|nr:MAG: NADPH:quinone oxidoreductase family protein [Pseudomonadota bacterium]MBC6960526.1 NADPH:quinone oxidoreductase family protein [Lautropia sp.]MCL4701140.1 NADPH:quinone oxidoreductase family protein [Burkholderiaceae bacterium]MCZ2412669.1 NADPH:quinone oxidoreductase family protein [Burkholderiales bacterium]MDL1908856.1 NADPH:quinone oxidoreductase family protein [Betaproteobacteria bacterium PRO1]
MKAVLCKAWGPPESLVIEEVPTPVPGAGQVLIEVHAAGVNFPDSLIIQKKYQLQPPLPFSPGAEVAGIVRAVGEGVKPWKPGDRVIANVPYGGYAQELVADAARVMPIPDGMDFPTASAYVLAYGTSLFALKDRAKLAPGETLLVLGAAGGVGIAAVEIGKAMGARVIAAASSEEKLALCREHGADETIDYAREDLRERIAALTGGKGPDVIYDPVGGPYTEQAFRSIAWEGRHLVIGFAAGEIPKLPLNLPLLKTASLVGAFWGAFVQRDPKRTREHLQELFELYQSKKVRPPITRTYPLAQAAQALRDVMERRVKGKVVILPRE